MNKVIFIVLGMCLLGFAQAFLLQLKGAKPRKPAPLLDRLSKTLKT